MLRPSLLSAPWPASVSFLTACPVKVQAVKRASAAPLLLAPVLGYLAAWFFWGVPLPWMLALLLGGAALWTFAPRRGQGGWTFSRSFLTVILLGLSLWILGAGVLWVPVIRSPDNPFPIGEPHLLALLLAGAAVIAASLAMVFQMASRASREQGQPVVVPWLWLAGCVAFALLPAVRVDCRGLDRDSFLSSSSGFSGAAGRNYWGNHPERITGRAQLPADLGGLEVQGGATSCTRDAAGRSRVFSFRASEPQILVRLSEYGGARRTFYALFSVGQHQQLTPWKAGKWVSIMHAGITNYLAWRNVPVVEGWPAGIPTR